MGRWEGDEGDSLQLVLELFSYGRHSLLLSPGAAGSAKPDFPRVSPKPSLTLLKGNRFSTSLAVLTLSLVCPKPVLPLLLRKP